MNKQTVLENGTRIVTERIPEFRSCTLGAWISTGSRFESEEDAGLAHFLEHLLFKGTKTRTAYDIAKQSDNHSLAAVLKAGVEQQKTPAVTRPSSAMTRAVQYKELMGKT